MFFLLNLVLTILLNKTYAQDGQIILLPAWNLTGANNISLTLKVFGQLIQLNLRRTHQITSPTFDVWNNTISVMEKWSQSKASNPCFYVHKNRVSSAIINFCQKDGLEGLVFLKNKILKIKPLRNNFTSLSLTDDFCVRKQINSSFGKPYFIERLRQYFSNSNFHYLDNFKQQQRHLRSTRQLQSMQKKLVIELAVFFDEKAYHKFIPVLGNSEEQLRNMILAYVNRIQAAFHHPTFGVPLDILLVRLDIIKKQQLDLPLFDGNGSKLFRSFCEYAKTLNPPNDNNPHHWDIGLYITGIDIYRIENGQKNDYLRSSTTNALCHSNYPCAMIEFGVDGVTSGFASSLNAASQIANILGISVDNDTINSPCANYKHIMATKRQLRGQVTWSKCSRDVAKKLWRTKTCLLDHTNQKKHVDTLDHTRYHDLPGRKWSAKAQCEIYLRDNNANVVTLHDICQILQCETPNNTKLFYAGPALDGTYCALGKECRGGECAPVLEPPYDFKYCERDEWSEWKKNSCNNSCLGKSKGVIIKRRICKHGRFRTANCKEPYYAVDMCNDSNACNNNQTIEEFTKTKCTKFSSYMERYGKMYVYKVEKKPGWQATHNVMKPWIACTIFCYQERVYPFPYKQSPIDSLRLELLGLGVDPYFPDGTWCHKEGDQNYYCRQHYCLPENYSFKEYMSKYF